jgi:nitroimidazol reductase NimA-like FMN-containing flavoprotein (pyridoxamine 5'-phosphate oxidase superfamily)/ribosomal protein S18 acetylase RimI-like enzyme
MRKAIYRAPEAEARALFARAPAVHLATTDDDGAPLLRTVHAVLVGDRLLFHGAPAGEKMRAMGRAAVAEAAEIVASIPSTFLDPERACPATTYYLSAQAHGELRTVEDPAEKAAALEALMQRYQPEGGYVPIAADHPLYRKAVQGLLVAELAITHLSAKAKLGQNRTPAERVRVVEALWERGAGGDVRAAALLLARFPDLPAPRFLPKAPRGVTFLCDLDAASLDLAAELVAAEDWAKGTSKDVLVRSFEASSARVGARDERGRLVAFARAVADGRTAWLYDVVVAPERRGQGLGRAVAELLLDHPAVRRTRVVRLTTRDAEAFWRARGLLRLEERPRHPWVSVEMIGREP